MWAEGAPVRAPLPDINNSSRAGSGTLWEKRDFKRPPPPPSTNLSHLPLIFVTHTPAVCTLQILFLVLSITSTHTTEWTVTFTRQTDHQSQFMCLSWPLVSFVHRRKLVNATNSLKSLEQICPYYHFLNEAHSCMSRDLNFYFLVLTVILYCSH